MPRAKLKVWSFARAGGVKVNVSVVATLRSFFTLNTIVQGPFGESSSLVATIWRLQPPVGSATEMSGAQLMFARFAPEPEAVSVTAPTS